MVLQMLLVIIDDDPTITMDSTSRLIVLGTVCKSGTGIPTGAHYYRVLDSNGTQY